MRTDLRVNYAGLDFIKSQLMDYHDILEDVESAVENLNNLLLEQESEAVEKLVERIADARVDMSATKAALEALGDIVTRFDDEMRERVAPKFEGPITRVDTRNISRRLRNMRSSIDSAYLEASLPTPTSFVLTIGLSPEEAASRRIRMEGNFTRLDTYRQISLLPILDNIVERLEEMFDIERKYVGPFQDTDRRLRALIDDLFQTHTNQSTRWRNGWELFASVTEAFLQAFVIAFVIAAAIVKAPFVVIGIAVVLTAYVVVMAALPDQHVPEWLSRPPQSVVIRDAVRHRSLQVIDNAIEDWLFDQVQTPEGIASVLGSVTGGATGGILATGGTISIGIRTEPLFRGGFIHSGVNMGTGAAAIRGTWIPPISIPIPTVVTNIGVGTMATGGVAAVCAMMSSPGSGGSGGSGGGTGNLKKIRSNQRANEIARELGFEGAEDLKRAFAFRRGTRFNMNINMSTGEIVLVPIQGGSNINTGLFTTIR
jgi:hypothetical protein